MRLSRDSWLAIGLLLLLMVVTVVAAVYQSRSQERYPALSSLSSQPDGARALQLWLEENGFRTSNDVGRSFQIPEEASLVFMLEPAISITDEEWEHIDEWVEAGGLLVAAGEWWGLVSMADHYDFGVTHQQQFLASGDELPAATPQTVLLDSPPLPAQVPAHAWRTLTSQRDDFIVLLAAESQPVVATFAQGKGRVILCSAPFSFTNLGLKQAGNPELVANLAGLAGQPRLVWFDEWHHGLQEQASLVLGPEQWLRRTPAGRALLLVAAVTFLALLLRGRRFGRPVPLARTQARRAPLEHISAIANLSRRAGHRSSVLRDYRQRLKRNLGKRYRLDPTMPDDEYVRRLAEMNPQVDQAALRRLLARLQLSKASESEMIQLAAEVAAWLNGSLG